jgi:hypothetical protein
MNVATMDMMARPSLQTRWYDTRPLMNNAIQLLEAFPSQILSILALGLSQMAESQFQVSELIRRLKSLGVEQVSALYKAQSKRRKGDQNQAFHQAMNQLRILPHESQDYMALRVFEIVQHLQDYLTLCKRFERSALEAEIQQLVSLYAVRHSAGVEPFLKQFELYLTKQRGLSTLSPDTDANSLFPKERSESDTDIQQDELIQTLQDGSRVTARTQTQHHPKK